jgi:hypothetical protein
MRNITMDEAVSVSGGDDSEYSTPGPTQPDYDYSTAIAGQPWPPRPAPPEFGAGG